MTEHKEPDGATGEGEVQHVRAASVVDLKTLLMALDQEKIDYPQAVTPFTRWDTNEAQLTLTF